MGQIMHVKKFLLFASVESGMQVRVQTISNTDQGVPDKQGHYFMDIFWDS